MNRRKLVDANVTDALKRRYPSKHYVYVIQVKWNDGSDTTIFRRYSKFFDFQISLLEAFPLEGGLKDPSARTIPFLPGKVLFRRSHIREVAMKRLKPIDEYCRALAQLPTHISQSNQVLDFFESKPEDLNPPKEDAANKKRRKDESVKNRRIRRTKSLDIGEISGPIPLEQYVAIADYTRTQPKELTVESGQYLEVIEKHENGWWFVSDEEGERGWIPGVYLEKRDGTHENLITKEAEPGQGEKYITTAKFVANNNDEVSFGLGVLVEVLQKNLEGWWRISYQGKEGWAPASYLDKPADVVLRQSNRNEHGVEIISSVHELKAHRRSLPSTTVNAVVPSPSSVPDLSSSASSSPKRLQVANRRSKEYHSACLNSAAVILTGPSQVPPPKRSSVKRGSLVQKPQVPPPLPPTYKLAAKEPVYEYVAKASFAANIPEGVSLSQDAKVEVIEKSPGGWWYIAVDGNEGWAPSSYIEKQFKSKPVKPPERPKPPKPAGVGSHESQTKPISPKRPLMKSHSTSSTCEAGKILSAMRPLPPLPSAGKQSATVPDPPSHAKHSTSSATGNNSGPASGSCSDAKTAIPTPAAVAASISLNKVESQETKPAAEKEGRKLQPNKTATSGDRTSTPPKRPLRPQTSSDSNPKPISTVTKKQPNKPPAPALGKKKPVVQAKSIGAGENSVVARASKIGAEINLRNALKPVEKNGLKGPAKKSENPPPKPNFQNRTPPKQDSKAPNSVSSLRSRFQNDAKASGPARPKPAIPHAKPLPVKPKKPAIPQTLKSRNANGNNNTEPEENEVIIGRMESCYIAPSGTLPKLLRGSPDGQVDEGFVDEKGHKTGTHGDYPVDDEVQSERKHRYVAVADFMPQDESELGFSEGAVATLIDKAKSDWWYMMIDNKSGWVPSAFFELESCTGNKIDNNGNKELVDEATAMDPDTVYSEIDDRDAVHQGNGIRCVVLSAFEASGEGTMSVTAGDILEVLEQTESWWFASVIFSSCNDCGHEGWVPFDHLQIL